MLYPLLLIPFSAFSQDMSTQCNTSVSASDSDKKPVKVDKLNIVTHPIFDETDPDTIFLHELANWLHINTKEDVIEERLSFKSGDTINQDDLAEAERIIRSQPYLRDAKLSFASRCNEDEPVEVDVQTWDNWSMTPTISFGRKGGENKLTVGLKEDNLLGLGIRTRFRYNSDVQRTGYQLTMQSATPFVPHSTVLFDFVDNDDGQRTQFVFDKPFYQLSSQNMLYAEFLRDEKTEDVFQGGVIRNQYNLQNHRYEIATGWQLSRQDNTSTRLKLGWVEDEALFTATNPQQENDTQYVPQDHRYSYPWVGFEYFEREYKVMNDIYLINQAEDINLGWHYEAKLGLELKEKAPDSQFGYHLSLESSKGYMLGDALVLFSFGGEAALSTTHKDQYRIALNSEYFERVNDLLGIYARATAVMSDNPFLDSPLTLGDENGVRGYPLQYQHGDRAFSSTLEARFYTGYNIYKILDVGFAAFIDAGRAWSGDEATNNEISSTLASAGIGARLYSNRSSHKSVLHIDFAKPFTSSENVDSWEWRLQVKQSF